MAFWDALKPARAPAGHPRDGISYARRGDVACRCVQPWRRAGSPRTGCSSPSRRLAGEGRGRAQGLGAKCVRLSSSSSPVITAPSVCPSTVPAVQPCKRTARVYNYPHQLNPERLEALPLERGVSPVGGTSVGAALGRLPVTPERRGPEMPTA